MSEWYRNTEWSSETEQNFFTKLSRARSQRAQYLRIQACYLTESHPKVALRLLDLYFESGDKFDIGVAHTHQADAYISLEQYELAVQAFEKTLEHQQLQPNVITSAWFRLPLLVAVQKLSPRYEQALALIKSRLPTFPVESFCVNAVIALINAAQKHDAAAREAALVALTFAASEKSPFSRHPNIGLVGPEYTKLIERLTKLAQPKHRWFDGSW